MAKKSIAVFGLGRFGSAFAKTAAELGHEVIGIDKDETAIKELSPYLVVAAQADLYKMTKNDILSLGVRNVDFAVVAISELDLSALLSLELLEEGIRVVARANSELQARLLRKLGVEKVIMPAAESGVRAAYQLLEGHIYDVMGIYTDLVMSELKPPNSWVGKKLSELKTPTKYGILIIGVKNKEDFILGNSDYVVRDSDILLIAGKTQDVYSFLRQQRQAFKA
ncbi:potassium channel family protein [Coprothermobacter platensis]|uniref:potassium channel family protein n=1 Tax=Coprothermobacter platensis TaxID=108819 RepID=UPI00037052C9|nr:TrkA family potassium uptake protein [Coprothermobacter platensis]